MAPKSTANDHPSQLDYYNFGNMDEVLPEQLLARLKRDEAGLFAAIAQQYNTLEVLMLAWMDDEALRRTIVTGKATYWSRSRREYWRKGATSGHEQLVKSINLDCDGDAVLLMVDQIGAACHTGAYTCFYTPIEVTGDSAINAGE